MHLLSQDYATIDINNIRHQGNRILVPGTLAIAGQWMKYLNEDGSERWEYLPEETLFNKDSLATLQGAPLGVEHPGEVTSDNYRSLVSQGKVVGSISTSLNIDSQRKQLDLIAMVYDKPTIDMILAGDITELSPQYYKSIDKHPEYKDGCYIQTARDYSGCEVSLVKRARGGKDASLHISVDSANEPPSKYFLLPQTKHTHMTTINIDGIDVNVNDDRDKSIIQKAFTNYDANEKKLTKERDDALSSADSANSKIATLEAKIATLEADNAQLVKDKAEFEKKAKDEAEQRDRADVIKVAMPIFKTRNADFNVDSLKDVSNRSIKEKAISISLDSLPAVTEKRLDKCSDSEIKAYWNVVVSNSSKDSEDNNNRDSSLDLQEAANNLDSLDDIFVVNKEGLKLEQDSMAELENAWMQEI